MRMRSPTLVFCLWKKSWARIIKIKRIYVVMESVANRSKQVLLKISVAKGRPTRLWFVGSELVISRQACRLMTTVRGTYLLLTSTGKEYR
jgi:hypothetical protein